jgi:hypothetical protein
MRCSQPGTSLPRSNSTTHISVQRRLLTSPATHGEIATSPDLDSVVRKTLALGEAPVRVSRIRPHWRTLLRRPDRSRVGLVAEADGDGDVAGYALLGNSIAYPANGGYDGFPAASWQSTLG